MTPWRVRVARRVRRMREDRGQVAVEFLGMLPLIVTTLVLLWQCALVGFTYTLAGNAADRAARAGSSGGPGACERGGTEDLGASWRAGAAVSCTPAPGLVKAEVALKVPVLFPGSLSFPFRVTGEAAAVKED
ncbi:TadE family protein [Streptomyces purpurogeneiscleroticus]|uniref:TadE family protein n=1 Tax=Streptomyces purpurogeneiscleroticus TaxID=68259 RepID=UPI001CBE4AA4|nr:TadE family protein [Streptomyces purpurogeneiscleroticus]MBZ4020718.1 septum formation initiator [Streptomyces purpurogeneiscleroticus]